MRCINISEKTSPGSDCNSWLLEARHEITMDLLGTSAVTVRAGRWGLT